MDRDTHLLCESVQEITLYAWPIIYADNKYDQDSRDVLMTLREWGEEFENLWINKDGDYKESHEWIEELWKFADIRCQEYLRNIGAEDDKFNRDMNLQEFTAEAISKSVWHILFFDKNYDRSECFKIIREWADKFWEDYQERDVYADYEAGLSYYDLVDEFLDKKADELTA